MIGKPPFHARGLDSAWGWARSDSLVDLPCWEMGGMPQPLQERFDYPGQTIAFPPWGATEYGAALDFPGGASAAPGSGKGLFLHNRIKNSGSQVSFRLSHTWLAVILNPVFQVGGRWLFTTFPARRVEFGISKIFTTIPFMTYDVNGVNSFHLPSAAEVAQRFWILAGTYDKVSIDLWINGKRVSSVAHTADVGDDADSLEVGVKTLSESDAFDGQLLFFGLRHRAWSAAEILAWSRDPFGLFRPRPLFAPPRRGFLEWGDPELFPALQVGPIDAPPALEHSPDELFPALETGPIDTPPALEHSPDELFPALEGSVEIK